jgi:hypothetical protein
MTLLTFEEAGLPIDSTDRTVWRFVQARRMLLLNGNRNMTGPDSLEQTIREENTPTSLPILTITNVSRINKRTYRERCNSRIVEIVLYIANYLGTGRVFVP